MNINRFFRHIQLSVRLHSANFKKNIYLTISVAVSMLIFLSVALYMDFNYATKAREYDKFQENYIIIDSGEPIYIKDLQNMFEGANYFVNTYCNANASINTKSGAIEVLYNVAVTDSMICDIYFNNKLYGATDYANYEKYSILYGRSNFSSENEVIISEEHANFIAGTADKALGKKILLDFGEGWGSDIYEVVGVYKQTLSESRQNKGIIDMQGGDLNKSKKSEKTGNFLTFNIFVSPGSVNIKTDSLNMDYTMYLFYDSIEQKELFLSKLSIDNPEDESKHKWNYFLYEDAQLNKVYLHSSLTFTKASVMAIVTIICGMSIFGTMVNSIGDRKKEIGIKKALGASDGDIMLGFIVENIINIGMAVVLASVVVSLLFLGYGYYQRNALFVDYIYVFYPETIILFLIFAMSSMLGFSLIPAYKASQVNVIEIIRVE